MNYLALLPVTVILALASPPHPKAGDNAKECLGKLSHRNEDLSRLTKQSRDRLINSPGQIDLVVDSANSANAQDKPQIELGIVRAVEYLRCVDPSGYQAISAYLNAHSDSQVVTDIDKALGSQVSVGDGGGGGGGGGGLIGGGGDGGGGFAGGGPTVSQH